MVYRDELLRKSREIDKRIKRVRSTDFLKSMFPFHFHSFLLINPNLKYSGCGNNIPIFGLLGIYRIEERLILLQKKTQETKIIPNFMLNHVLFYHFPEKTCWKSYSTVYFFDIAPVSCTVTPFLSIKTKQIFHQSQVLITFFSKYFWENGKTKRDSA